MKDLLRELANMCDKANANPLKVNDNYLGGNHLTGKPSLIVEVTKGSFIRLFKGQEVHSQILNNELLLRKSSASGKIHFTCLTRLPNIMTVTASGFSMAKPEIAEKTQPRDEQGRFVEIGR